MRSTLRRAARWSIPQRRTRSARIAALLREWSDDPAECAAIGARGRAHVLEHFAREDELPGDRVHHRERMVERVSKRVAGPERRQ